MKNLKLFLMLIVISGLLALSAPLARACGIIDIDRRPLPPDVQVTNISVKNTGLDIKIEEQVAVVTVDEVFHNPNNRQLEGTFILPILPETAVQDLSLWINGKETKAELLDRAKALQYYQETVRRMIDPALLEYAGYGLLKLRVFPIPAANQDLGQGPGNVRVKYTYSCRLVNDNGFCVLRHPWGTNKFSQEPIDSAVIRGSIKSAIPVKAVYSPTYPNIDVIRKSDNLVNFSFEQTKMKPDKDFVLYYSLSDKQFGLNLLTSRPVSADGFFMMLLSPKYDLQDNEVVKKDVVFVLDTSGSMKEADKIVQAKNALSFCINSLRDTDRFNLITFSSESRRLKDKLQEVTKSGRDEALKWVAEIEARGGTNIDEALQAALGMAEPDSPRPFIVVFLTDGIPTVGEQQPEAILKNLAAKNKPNTRIFTFGVGYDVNTFLLDKIAETGRGAREYIIPGENIEVKVSNFYDKIAYPVLSDVRLDISGKDIITYNEVYDIYPKKMPDLFRGSQLVLLGRYNLAGQKLITLNGNVNGQPRKFEYENTFPDRNDANDFIPRLWATSKVGYLMDEIRLRGENKEVKDEIIKLANEYGILTPYTSWLVLEDIKTGGTVSVSRNFLGDIPKEARDEASRRNTPTPPGAPSAGAVSGSQEAQKLQSGTTAGIQPEGALGKLVNEAVKRIADKTFYLTQGVWYDSRYNEKDKKEKVQVKYLSDEYFALITKSPQLGKYFAVGSRVMVCFNDKVYEVISE